MLNLNDFRESYIDMGNYMYYCGSYVIGTSVSILDATRTTQG